MHLELIIAVDSNFGLGYNNTLPWKNKEELELFKNKTFNSTLIVGRKTFHSLPKLHNRNIICITRNKDKDYILKNSKNLDATVVSSIDEALLLTDSTENKIYIAGGAEIYKLVLSNYFVKRIHISILIDRYTCDTYFDYTLLKDFYIVNHDKYSTFDHYVLEKSDTGEHQYLTLLNDILKTGKIFEGRNGQTISTFVNHLKFDLTKGFPLLTTKKMFWKGIVEELLFFLRGDTDTKILENKGIHIWKANTTKEFIKSRNLNYSEGVFGPIYGYQWRHFNSPYIIDDQGKPIKCMNGIDQLENVINLIKTDPNSRRILMTTFNPSQSDEGVLLPCHSIALQFYVDGDYLDMYCFNRSSDVFLGLPFNIASSSLMLMIIAKITGKISRYFHLSLGDTHIYINHIDQVKEQIKRIPFKFCNIILPDINSISDLVNLEFKDFKLINYNSHTSIKADMIA